VHNLQSRSRQVGDIDLKRDAKPVPLLVGKLKFIQRDWLMVKEFM